MNLMLLFLLLSCDSNKSSDGDFSSFLAHCNVVAERAVIDGDTVIICDYQKIRQRISVPLDALLTDFQTVKMENANDEGLIGSRLPRVVAGEEYIAIYDSKGPLKLYNKNGDYLRTVGSIGQGPGEYQSIYYFCMDEDADRIFVLTFDFFYVLVYDFSGKFRQAIPLAERALFGMIIPDMDKQLLTVIAVPFRGTTNTIWVQDWEGNMIQSIKHSHFFSDDDMPRVCDGIVTRLRTSNIEFFWGYCSGGKFNHGALYHYNMKENRAIPKFRMKNEDKAFSGGISIYELPHHFVIEEMTHVAPGKDDIQTSKIILDKHTLKGAYFDGFLTPQGLLLDQYFILNTAFRQFAVHDFGSFIGKKIEKIDLNTLSAEEKKELEKLQQLFEGEDIIHDDFSLLFYGNFKQ